MSIIYLSPHWDDAVLSCGGLLWKQWQDGENTEVWTVCAGLGVMTHKAARFHQLWDFESPEQYIATRQPEDDRALGFLKAKPRRLGYADEIYRDRDVDFTLPGLLPGDSLVCPMAIGHVDHGKVREAAERLGVPLLYYAEVPYLWRYPLQFSLMMDRGGFQHVKYQLPPNALAAWLQAVSLYESQIGMLFGDGDKMRREITQYFGSGEFCLYKKGK